jgi:hypothetical protein
MAGLGNAIVNQIYDPILILRLNNLFQIVVEKAGKHGSRQSILKERETASTAPPGNCESPEQTHMIQLMTAKEQS